MSKEDWQSTPFCPLRPGEDCSYKCALAVRLGKSGRVACAIAMIAAKGTDYTVNDVQGQKLEDR